jgi:hypothetical protein
VPTLRLSTLGRMAMTGRRLSMRREAIGFAVGSVFFFAGSLPLYADAVGAVVANATFFVGSLFFTTAGTIQLLLSGRVPPRAGTGRADAWDWWSALVQWIGTLLFNISTLMALIAALARPDDVGVGWTSDFWGSVMFLLSGICALVALSRAHELWDINARTPGAVWLGMLGSIAFAAAALGAYVAPGADSIANLVWVNVGTAAGAVCFFVAAFFTRPAVMPDNN